MRVRTIGLVTFVIVAVVDCLVLVFDLSLILSGHCSISEAIRGDPASPFHGPLAWLGVVTLAWQVGGAIGLGIHFWGPAAPSRQK